jgi:uncharacterized membrane protein (DUF485 family)
MLWPRISSGTIEAAMTRNARVGLVLFCVYLVLYGGFVLLNAFSPTTMEATPIAGINLAILYGFGLIVAAIVLALLYGFLCRVEVPRDARASATRSGDVEASA